MEGLLAAPPRHGFDLVGAEDGGPVGRTPGPCHPKPAVITRALTGYGACTVWTAGEARHMNAQQVAEDVLFYRTMMVNVFVAVTFVAKAHVADAGFVLLSTV